MTKIPTGYYCHNWDYRGTSSCLERVIQKLSTRFEPFILYWPKAENTRLGNLAEMVGRDHLIPFERSDKKSDAESGYTPLSNNFYEVAQNLNLDILHVARSGYFEFPFNARHAKLQIETNVFGHKDRSEFCDRSLFISNYVKNLNNMEGEVVYIPIPKPTISTGNLREKFNIPQDAVVLGRLGAPSNFSPIAVNAFKRVLAFYPNTYFLIHSPCGGATSYVSGVPNVILLEPTNDDEEIEQFWNTVDIFAHYRSDGECFGAAIAEAMIRGKPVVSHYSYVYDAHVGTISNGGTVCDNEEEYFKTLMHWIRNPGVFKYIGSKAKQVAEEKYDQEKVVRNIEEIYLKWLSPLGVGVE